MQGEHEARGFTRHDETAGTLRRLLGACSTLWARLSGDSQRERVMQELGELERILSHRIRRR
jgi:hypothetical protein